MLRNTPWVVGLVLNTGPDTKIIMSSLEVCGVVVAGALFARRGLRVVLGFCVHFCLGSFRLCSVCLFVCLAWWYAAAQASHTLGTLGFRCR